MVQDRITDGYRIAELLASEVDGRQSGPLGRLAVANPDRSASGTAAGERAFDVRVLEGDRDPRREPPAEALGERFARLFVHDEGATVALESELEAAASSAEAEGLETTPDWREGSLGVHVPTGAAVKRAVDVLAAAVSATGSDRRLDRDGNG